MDYSDDSFEIRRNRQLVAEIMGGVEDRKPTKTFRQILESGIEHAGGLAQLAAMEPIYGPPAANEARF